jgi:hypothetical protein
VFQLRDDQEFRACWLKAKKDMGQNQIDSGERYAGQQIHRSRWIHKHGFETGNHVVYRDLQGPEGESE